MDNPLQRLKKFTEYKKLSISAFEKSVGFSNGSFASQLKNNKTIGLDKLENILKVYPELSGEWVLTGKGEMIDTLYQGGKTLINDNSRPILTARQRFIIDDSVGKLLSFIRNETPDYAVLYENLNHFERLRHFADLFSQAFSDKILNSVYSADKYLIDGKINFEEYKSNVLKDFEQVLIVNEPLKKFIQSVEVFYSEIKPIDKNNMLDEIDY